MLESYRDHVQERAAQGIPPLPLDAEQTAALVELLKAPPAGEEAFLVDLLTQGSDRLPLCVAVWQGNAWVFMDALYFVVKIEFDLGLFRRARDRRRAERMR